MKQFTFSVVLSLFLLALSLPPAEPRQARTTAHVTSHPRSSANFGSPGFRDHQVRIVSPARLSALQTSHFEARQFRTTVPVVSQPRFSPGFRSPVFIDRRGVIVTAAPVRVFQTRRFQTVIVVPRHTLVSRPVIISHPFIGSPHHPGFFREDFFFDHIHRFHGLSFESIPQATVQNGSQIIFFDEGSGSVAPSTDDNFTEDQ